MRAPAAKVVWWWRWRGGITVYPARHPGDRWRAVWYENGQRRQCQSVTEAGLAARLEKISVRLAADAADSIVFRAADAAVGINGQAS